MYTPLLLIAVFLVVYCNGYVLYKKYTAPVAPVIYYDDIPYRPLLEEELLKGG
jgi:hypothetical protein